MEEKTLVLWKKEIKDKHTRKESRKATFFLIQTEWTSPDEYESPNTKAPPASTPPPAMYKHSATDKSKD